MIGAIERPQKKAFSKGFSSVFDISGMSLIEFHDFSGGFEQDTRKLSMDWYLIGGDIRKSMNQVANEQKQ